MSSTSEMLNSGKEIIDLKLEIARLKKELDKSKKDSERLTFMIEADNDRERAYFSGSVYDDISVLNGADDDADIQEDFRRLIDLHMEERDKNKLRIALEACDELSEACDELSKENAELINENQRIKAELAEKSWRPITESPVTMSEYVNLIAGKWRSGAWQEIVCMKGWAITNGYTHYLPKPEPPKENNA